MDNTIRFASHLGPFGSMADRYNLRGYQQVVGVDDRIRQAAKVHGLSGIELNFRGLVDEQTAPGIKALLDSVGLQCINISLNVWGDPKWGLGSITSPEPSVRKEAVDLMIAGMRTAKVLGCQTVSLWPGQEGFDYPFQVDYGNTMDWFIGGLCECADAVPDVRIAIEYKTKEPRAHLYADTVGRTMWMINKAARPNIGILLDIGHAMYAYENVAQSAVLVKREGLLYLLHWNENYGEWDWDMIPGTVRFWEHIELIFWLRELGYDGWNSMDISVPRGGDPISTIQQGVDNVRRMYRLAETLDREVILANLREANVAANMRLLSDQVFSALGV